MRTKVVEVSLPELAGGVLKSAEQITRVHLEDHTCAVQPLAILLRAHVDERQQLQAAQLSV